VPYSLFFAETAVSFQIVSECPSCNELVVVYNLFCFHVVSDFQRSCRS